MTTSELLMHCVNDIMTREVVTIEPDATIGEAIELLLARRISGLPVVDASGNLVGILTEFALMALAYDSDVTNQPVSRHMTCEVLSVDVSDRLNKVADLCLMHRVRRLPVLSEGRLAGLVSRRDVLAALYHAKAPVDAC